MVTVWEFSHTPILDDKETQIKLLAAKFRERPDELRRIFMEAYWSEKKPSANIPYADGARLRENLYYTSQQFARFIYLWLATATWRATDQQLTEAGRQLGLDFVAFRQYLNRPSSRPSYFRKKLFKSEQKHDGAIEVHDVRPTFRVRPDGRTKVELLVILTQRRVQLLTDDDDTPISDPDGELAFYHLRGGCTLLIDPEKHCIRYAVVKSIASKDRRKKIEQFLRDPAAGLGKVAFDQSRLRPNDGQPIEPLAILHRTFDYGAC
jgi:hypothetical protein